MAIMALLGLGLSVASAAGVGDETSTQTTVQYNQFGNFQTAGTTPGEAAGAIETEKTEEVKFTGISDALGMAGSILPAVEGAAEGMKSDKPGGGGYYADDKVEARQANRQSKRDTRRANRRGNDNSGIYNQGNMGNYDQYQ